MENYDTIQGLGCVIYVQSLGVPQTSNHKKEKKKKQGSGLS